MRVLPTSVFANRAINIQLTESVGADGELGRGHTAFPKIPSERATIYNYYHFKANHYYFIALFRSHTRNWQGDESSSCALRKRELIARFFLPFGKARKE